MGTSNPKFSMYFIIIALIIALDQFTKYIIRVSIELNQSVPVIDGIFHITYIHNSGAAFSIFENKTLFLVVMQLIVITVALIFLIMKQKQEHWCLLLSVSMIAAGGIGNMIDRIINGYVVDFFDFRIWPIFNIADISVCIGCGLLIIYMFFIEPKRTKENRTDGKGN
jgi:lipoprotein signal peptidase